MMDSKMIETIVKEVISQLEGIGHSVKPKLLVVSKEEGMEGEINVLLKDWEIVRVHNQSKISFNDIQQALFLNVHQDALARMAAGFTDTHESKLFADLIYHEMPITMTLEASLQKLLDVNGKTHRYPNYIKKIVTFKETVEGFGVNFQSVNTLKAFKMQDSQILKKLITQEDIENLVGKRLTVKPRTIITPLAKDKARELGIEIYFT
ncbi:hypothetical protein ACFYKX_09625 [Cytobacillus sp. FJAT-54145]|uniref:Ethanolamine utilization protein n=1 Tax=Cytobacillus spartinae TaxID=3299023 RepID=A0ABW6K9I9_9BACI